MDWKVIYVKPRTEKKVESALLKMGIKAYCPVVTEIHQWSDRKKKVEVPILKSYVFVQPDDKKLDAVFQVNHVVRYLFWLGKPAIVRDNEIQVMQNWLVKGNTESSVESIQPGDKLDINTGPFKGQKGLVKEISKNRIQLLLLDLEMKITLNRN
ncbi:UpxY family transcription antiterminator [Algibacter sp. L4_22]|uniref:UpxY family transcription antiterminator n=1 Tax=Algibacter sp. L4_22 TaxID=2942477 RepID=UPI00201B64A8|nr:UpxY family transcription antiterminator [Algibacter sp. L4_22]MCL5129851.1 UpxY family transcription antiterminator [Algibacter sp. L4_22]